MVANSRAFNRTVPVFLCMCSVQSTRTSGRAPRSLLYAPGQASGACTTTVILKHFRREAERDEYLTWTVEQLGKGMEHKAGSEQAAAEGDSTESTGVSSDGLQALRAEDVEAMSEVVSGGPNCAGN